MDTLCITKNIGAILKNLEVLIHCDQFIDVVDVLVIDIEAVNIGCTLQIERIGKLHGCLLLLTQKYSLICLLSCLICLTYKAG